MLRLRSLLPILLVVLTSLTAPLAAWVGAAQLEPCCCVLEPLSLPSQPTPSSSCCSTQEPLPTRTSEQTCLCLPTHDDPAAPVMSPGTSTPRIDPRLFSALSRLSPVANVSHSIAPVWNRDPYLPAVKNGVRGRLALLSVLRN